MRGAIAVKSAFMYVTYHDFIESYLFTLDMLIDWKRRDRVFGVISLHITCLHHHKLQKASTTFKNTLGLVKSMST